MLTTRARVRPQDSAQDTPHTKFSARKGDLFPQRSKGRQHAEKKAGVLVILHEWNFKEKRVVCARVGW